MNFTTLSFDELLLSNFTNSHRINDVISSFNNSTTNAVTPTFNTTTRDVTSALESTSYDASSAISYNVTSALNFTTHDVTSVFDFTKAFNNELRYLDANNASQLSPFSPISSVEALSAIYRPTSLLIHKIIIPFWWLIGFPGNILAFSVWIQPRMRPSSGAYLAALAMTDLVFLVLHVPFELQYTWGVRVLEVPFLCQAFPLVYLSSQYLSLLLVFAFSVERYISICHPFVRASFCTTARNLVSIVALVAVSVLLNAVQVYFWEYSAEKSTCDLRIEVLVESASGLSVWLVWSWVTELLVFGAVPLAILVLNFLVLVELRRIKSKERAMCGDRGGEGRGGGGGDAGGRHPLPSSIKRSRSSSVRHRSGSPSATTVMLLAVSFYLIVATLPVTFTYILNPRYPVGNLTLMDTEAGLAEIWTDPVWQTYFKFWNVRQAIQDCGMSHFALNFYIYLVTGKIFRKELRRVLVRCRCCGWCAGGSAALTRSGSRYEGSEVQSFARRLNTIDCGSDLTGWTKVTSFDNS